MRNGFGKLSEDSQNILARKFRQQNGISEVKNFMDDDAISNWYSFEGTWKNGVRQGFGIERFSKENLKSIQRKQ